MRTLRCLAKVFDSFVALLIIHSREYKNFCCRATLVVGKRLASAAPLQHLPHGSG